MENLERQELLEKVISINRVAKVTKGGKTLSFSALVVVGNGNGQVGWGLGKSHEVAEAIKKGLNAAKKGMVGVALKGTSIPHQVIGHYGAAKVLLKPAFAGTGVIAGGTVRAVCDAAGIKDILTKSIGSDNPVNLLRATVEGLKSLENEEVVKARRGSA